MHLAWTPITDDTDGDTMCSSDFSLGTSQHTALLEHGGAQFDFQSADHFLTNPNLLGWWHLNRLTERSRR
jgi:hypothetical protein